jgi:hypothetical protein
VIFVGKKRADGEGTYVKEERINNKTGKKTIIWRYVITVNGKRKAFSASGKGAKETAKAVSSKAAPSKSDGYITKAKFDKIQNGMSYKDVKTIIGSDGDMMSETGTKGDQYYTVIYDWKAADGIANATFEFQGDKLQTKSQAGLS